MLRRNGLHDAACGGGLIYLSETFGPVVSFCSGWSGAWVSQTGGTAAIAMAGTSFTGSLFGGFTPLQISIVSASIVIILGTVNSCVLAYPRSTYYMAREGR